MSQEIATLDFDNFDLQEYATVQEVCYLLGLSYRHVLRMCQQGIFQSLQFAPYGRRYIHKASILAYGIKGMSNGR